MLEKIVGIEQETLKDNDGELNDGKREYYSLNSDQTICSNYLNF